MNTNIIYLCITILGIYAPILLFCIACILLIYNQVNTLLTYFIWGFIFNNIINIVLKLLLREPRPSNDKKIYEILVYNNVRLSIDKFGMPSGHSQNCMYILAFILMTFSNPIICGIFFIISFISLYQRYLNHNHTIWQIIVGSFIGFSFGLFIYWKSNQHIVGKIQIKQDDECYI